MVSYLILTKYKSKQSNITLHASDWEKLDSQIIPRVGMTGVTGVRGIVSLSPERYSHFRNLGSSM